MSSTLEFTSKISFKKSRKDAFSYLREVKNRKAFMHIVDETTVTLKPKGKSQQGMRFKEVTHFMGFDMTLEYEMTQFILDEKIEVKCSDGPFYPVMNIKLTGDAADKSKAEVSVSLHKGPLSLMPEFLLKPAVEKIISSILDNLVKCVNAS